MTWNRAVPKTYLVKLADCIVSLLEALQARGEVQIEPLAAFSPNDKETSMAQAALSGRSPDQECRRRIFLADVSDSLRQERTQLAGQLFETGMDVGVEVPPPYEVRLHDEQVKAALDVSFASIHISSRAASGQGQCANYSGREHALGRARPRRRISRRLILSPPRPRSEACNPWPSAEKISRFWPAISCHVLPKTTAVQRPNSP